MFFKSMRGNPYYQIIGWVVALFFGGPKAKGQIFQPGSQPVGSGHPDALSVPIQSSSGCLRCHGNYDASDDYEPFDSWRSSMMANATRDPVFRAALSIAEADHPNASDFCVRCHSPFAWYNGKSSLPEHDPSTGRRRFAPDENRLLSSDLDGVACMVCHRSEDPGDAQIRNTQLVLHDGAMRYGPYSYEDGVDPRHESAQSAFLSSSRFCGQCHDIDNPIQEGHFIDADGSLRATGEPFAIERTYTEWAWSAFAQRGPNYRTCQDCHMPEVGRPVLAATELEILRLHMSRHDFAGGSVWQPLALLSLLPPQAREQWEPLYRASSERSRRLLQSAASLSLVNHRLIGQSAEMVLRVTNQSGHKLPTGYPEGRRMWLSIEIRDESERLVGASGRYDSERGQLLRDPQLRTYEVKLGEVLSDGSVHESFHFIRNNVLLLDTRIPPEGFAPPPRSGAEPLGRNYRESTGAFRHFDEVHYRFEGLCGVGELKAKARLLYQANTREYMEFLRLHSPPSPLPELEGRSWGEIAFELWETHGGKEPIEMASIEWVLGPSPAPCETQAQDGGVGGGAPDALTAPPSPQTSAKGCGCKLSQSQNTTLSIWVIFAILASFRYFSRRTHQTPPTPKR